MKKMRIVKAATKKAVVVMRKIMVAVFFLSGLGVSLVSADYNFINQTPHKVHFDINHKHGGIKANTNTKFSIDQFTPRQHRTDGTIINVKATIDDPKKKQVVSWVEGAGQNIGKDAVFWIKSWQTTDPTKKDPATGADEAVTIYTIEVEPRNINTTDDVGALSKAKEAHQAQQQQMQGRQQQQGGGYSAYGQQQGRGGW